MITYIALLRGINVGGKNIIKMADLRHVFDTLGLLNVRTYIQSGNVLFQSDDGEQVLKNLIEHKLEAVFGYHGAVILRTSDELRQLIINCPFTEAEILKAEALAKVECFYTALLPYEPLPEKVELLNAYRTESDIYHVSGRDIYLLLHHSIRDSKLAGNLNKLDVPVTIRNWNTINKLASLAEAMLV